MIEFRDVTKTYPDGTHAVRDFSLVIPARQITVLVGSSGSGKTTLMRMINRMVDPTSGTEYTLPCVAEWSFIANPIAVALRVDGVPARAAGATPEMGTWRSPLGWSDPESESAG